MQAMVHARNEFAGRRRRVAFLLLVLWNASNLVSAQVAGGSDAGPAPRKNPHVEIGCPECHAEVPRKSESTPRSVLAGLTKEPVALCRGCHPDTGDSHHPVGKRAARAFPDRFPAGTAGEVLCSTCHGVHLPEGGNGLLRGFASGRYRVRMDLCLDCHAENYQAINPHRSMGGTERCHVCHSSGLKANPSDTIRAELDKICDFCHDIRRRNHPRNVARLKSLPRWLTVSRTGKLLCASCHDPHGTSDTIHFLRVPYLEYVDAARYENPHGHRDYYSCRVCHREVSPRSEEMRENLLFGGNEILLCYTCHGEMDACHLVLIRLPPGTAAPDGLPLTPDGRVTCSTCHDPTPAGGSTVAIRGVGAEGSFTGLCHRCHDKGYLAGVNPHTATSVKTACRFCHAYMRDPERAERFQVSFISNSRVICLRCHDRDTHPMGTDIKSLVPGRRLPEPFRLDGKGRMTCTTCHKPHFDAWGAAGEEDRHRLVVGVEQGTICSLCHGE